MLLEYHQFSAGGFRQPSLSGKAAAGSVSKLGLPVSLDVDFYSRPFQYLSTKPAPEFLLKKNNWKIKVSGPVIALAWSGLKILL